MTLRMIKVGPIKVGPCAQVILFLSSIAVLVWFLARADGVHLQVTEATFSQIDLNTTTSRLYYNLEVNLTIRNPNEHIGIHYGSIEAQACYYRSAWNNYATTCFNASTLPPFYQGGKNTTELNLSFNQVNMSFNKEYIVLYPVYVTVILNLRVRLKYHGLKTPRYMRTILCGGQKVPWYTNETTSSSFEAITCSRVDEY